MIFFWIAAVLFALASGGYVYAVVFRNSSVIPRITWVIIAGLISLTVSAGGRYEATGHLPWSGHYETAVLGAWLTVLIMLVIIRKRPALRLVGMAVLPFTVILMGFGAMSNPTLTPLDATLKTVWLYIHVYFAMISFGAYALAMGTGVIYLLKLRTDRDGTGNPVLMQLPTPERLDELAFRYVLFGFVLDAFMIAAGAIWAKDLWGSYWSWDPVETWSLISWLIYGLAIHLRVTMGWKGVRFAWLVIAAMSSVLIAYFGVTFVLESSVHVFTLR